MLSNVFNVLNLRYFHIRVIRLGQTRRILLPKYLLQILKVILAKYKPLFKVVSDTLHLLRRLLNPNLSTFILALIELVDPIKQSPSKTLFLVAWEH